MIDTFQKIFLASIGATATTAEAVKKTLDEMVEKGRITKEEAREMADKMMDQGKQEFEEAKSEANTFFKTMMHRFNVATHEDLTELKDRIAALEAQVTALQQSGSDSGDS